MLWDVLNQNVWWQPRMGWNFPGHYRLVKERSGKLCMAVKCIANSVTHATKFLKALLFLFYCSSSSNFTHLLAWIFTVGVFVMLELLWGGKTLANCRTRKHLQALAAAIAHWSGAKNEAGTATENSRKVQRRRLNHLFTFLLFFCRPPIEPPPAEESGDEEDLPRKVSRQSSLIAVAELQVYRCGRCAVSVSKCSKSLAVIKSFSSITSKGSTYWPLIPILIFVQKKKKNIWPFCIFEKLRKRP